MSIATVGLPELARRHAAEEGEAFRAMVRKAVGRALVILVPVVAVLFVTAGELVELLFGRGAFSGADVAGSTAVLRVLSAGLLFFGVTPVLMSGLYARRAQRRIFAIMAATAAVNLVLAFALKSWLGLEGIALAFVCSSVVSVGLAWWSLLGRRESRFPGAS